MWGRKRRHMLSILSIELLCFKTLRPTYPANLVRIHTQHVLDKAATKPYSRKKSMTERGRFLGRCDRNCHDYALKTKLSRLTTMCMSWIVLKVQFRQLHPFK